MSLIPSIFEKLKIRGWMIATAESCTGGMIGAALTDIAGSSAFVDRGFITYSNEAKTDMLGVPDDVIQKYGAVSDQVVHAMAGGALQNSRAGITVAVTGIAGPGGGTAEKPVGLVYIGIATHDGIQTFEHHFTGDRTAIRQSTLTAALTHVLQALS